MSKESMADHIGLTTAAYIDKQRPRGKAPDSFASVVFLDTEFTTLELHKGPWLLSLGMVTQNGREFYAEIDTSIDPAYRKRSSDWVQENVLGQFCKVPGRALSPTRLAAELAEWIEELGKEGPIMICYDYAWDFEFLESALDKAGDVSCHIEPMHIGYLGDEEGLDAWDRSIELSANEGLSAHHTLADARALRAQFETVHGEPVQRGDNKPTP